MTAATTPPRCGDIWRERRGGRGSLPPRYVVIVSVLTGEVEIVSVDLVTSAHCTRWRPRPGAPHRRAALSRFNGRGSGYELHQSSEPELFPHTHEERAPA